VKALRNSALVREVGGVGYYPTSGIPFVHVDTGHVRMWPRIPRLELAALFPNGKTAYLPTDGKPITSQDYKLALAKGLVSKTMVASAAPLPKADSKPAVDVVAEAENDAKTKLDTPRPILASYAPATAEVIADDPRHPGAPPPPARLFTYASVGGMSLPIPGFGHKAPKEAAAPLPAPAPEYRSAEVVGAPEVDDDHPDELSYVPFEIAGLMTDASVTYSRTVAPMTHPEPPDDHFLVRLRVVHPLIACLVTALAVWIALRVEPVPGLSRRARLLGVLSGAQLLLGTLNVALDAPGWMQLVHLLAAQLLWISAVLLWSGWARRSTVSEVTRPEVTA
jgi:hypothetical protein